MVTFLPLNRVNPTIPTLLLVNPMARRGQFLFAQLRDILAQRLTLVDASLTASGDVMTERIRQGLRAGVQRFIVGGGDGTLAVAAAVLADTEGILGVLPLGTGNTFSRGLRLPRSLNHLTELLAIGPVARFDLGVAQATTGQATFLNSLTMGFSEQVVALLTRDKKKKLGHLAWIVEFRQALANTPPIFVTVTWPGGCDQFETRQLVVVNGRTVAAGIAPSPTSSGQDGLLEIFRLGGPSLLSIARLGTKLLTGQLMSDEEAHYRWGSEFSIQAIPALPAVVDGEIWMTPPFMCRVKAGAVRVISPSRSGQSPRRWPIASRTIGTPRLLVPGANDNREPLPETGRATP